jgi:hypothetical protein
MGRQIAGGRSAQTAALLALAREVVATSRNHRHAGVLRRALAQRRRARSPSTFRPAA